MPDEYIKEVLVMLTDEQKRILINYLLDLLRNP